MSVNRVMVNFMKRKRPSRFRNSYYKEKVGNLKGKEQKTIIGSGEGQRYPFVPGEERREPSEPY